MSYSGWKGGERYRTVEQVRLLRTRIPLQTCILVARKPMRPPATDSV